MTDPNCLECDGSGTVDYILGVDDSKIMDCEKCSAGNSDFDEDAAYEVLRDRQVEEYFDKLNDRD